jgi:hypothetical protein
MTDEIRTSFDRAAETYAHTHPEAISGPSARACVAGESGPRDVPSSGDQARGTLNGVIEGRYRQDGA